MRLKNSTQRNASSVVIYGAVFIVSAVFFSLLLWSPWFADPDSFYHARITALMLESGLLHEFPWIQYSNLAEQFTDQHLLYHIWLMPWVAMFGPLVGAKVGHGILLSLFSVSIFAILRSWKIPYAIPAIIVLYTVAPFVFRLGLVKAGPLAIGLLLIIIHLALHKKFDWAFVVSMAYAWAHGGFMLAPVLGGVLFLADTITASLKHKRFSLGDPRFFWVPLLGVLVGLIINPYFPGNIQFLWEQFFHIGVVNYAGELQVGAEWYSFDVGELISVISVLLIGVVGSIVIVIRNRASALHDTVIVGVFLISIALLFATLRSRRNIEYLVPFVWFWVAYIILPYIKSGKVKGCVDSTRMRMGEGWYKLFVGYFALTLVGGATIAVVGVASDLRTGFHFTKYQAASEYIANNAEPDTVIFHTDWDDWPMLFYHNPQNYYISGLDPTFTFLYDQAQYNRWIEIGRGKVKEGVAQVIIDEFSAEYVFIDRAQQVQQLLDAYLLRDPVAELVFVDGDTRVYHIQSEENN